MRCDVLVYSIRSFIDDDVQGHPRSAQSQVNVCAKRAPFPGFPQAAAAHGDLQDMHIGMLDMLMNQDSLKGRTHTTNSVVSSVFCSTLGWPDCRNALHVHEVGIVFSGICFV